MYLEFYGLKSKPFQLSPDPLFFFSSELHKKALSYLKYGLSQQEGFIVITGAIGTGKTTIARALLDDVDGGNIVAAQLVTTLLEPLELLEMIAAAFKINVVERNKTAILQSIEKFLIALNEQGKRAVLLVDEAQNLPAESVEELRMLSNFQIGNMPLFQSFLLGQNELRTIIQAPGMEQFRQRIIASCHLAPLTQEETRHYINHRLKQAGWQGDSLISFTAFSIIHHQTQGIPRMINLFMDRLMLFGFIEELKHFNVEAIDTVLKEMSNELNMTTAFQSAKVEQNPIVQPALRAPTKQSETSKELELLLTQAIDKIKKLDTKVTMLLNKS
ncbi:XrtA/PEP-CTERM system-associated ATPase [Psychrobium sp. 1_MG-2023]|uniref:XrtA/PEP-CTERM system-associated ATPase n=1 Tax=Psychrobium sp. 1_MG-2023 TaxID=3062624 RepID=UPI000C3242DC|nr:XrtA/PEP-CTERM system-associated ATPase [Psychrobium sp. 1_MG-2023]MDP2561119.1 XrtA-associated ATPase [Psychrobium sp. 1_MG-2023]PKF55095.1 general secretion pathway protein GspA [Alteromonadales bacterium alter-6D02]